MMRTSLDRVGEWMRLMTKHEHSPDTLRDILYRGDRDDVIWEAEHCAEAWEADIIAWCDTTVERDALRQRLEEARLAWEECNFVELDAALAAGETYPSDAACTRHLGEPWPCPRCAAGEKP